MIRRAQLAEDFVGFQWDVFSKENSFITLSTDIQSKYWSILTNLPVMWWLMLQYAFDNFKKARLYLSNDKSFTRDPNCVSWWVKKIDTVVPSNYESFFESIWFIITSIIFTYASLESTMNELLEDKQLQKIHKGKKIDLPLEEKIKKIKLNNSSHSIFSDQKIKESYKELKKMRDRVIHLKKTYTLVEDQDKWRQIINQDIDYPKIAYDLLMRLYKSTNDIRLDWIKKIEIGW